MSNAFVEMFRRWGWIPMARVFRDTRAHDRGETVKRNILALVLGCLILAVPIRGFTTTWATVEETCPVCGETIQLESIASYGSYIYNWPSKLQLVFWPDTDAYGVWFCKHCHYAAFMGDFKHLPDEAVERVREALAAARQDEEGDSYAEVSILYRLRMAQVAYEARGGSTDYFWCHFHRVLGYHKAHAGEAEEAREARLHALEVAERMLGAEDNETPAKELLFVVASMQVFTDQDEAALETLDRMAAAPMEPRSEGVSEEDMSGYGAYLDEVAAELREMVAPAEPASVDPADADPAASRALYDFSDAAIAGDLVQPKATYLSPTLVLNLPPAGRGGPRDLARREAWVARQLARGNLSAERRVALMADMAERHMEVARSAWLTEYEDYDLRWEAWFQGDGSGPEPEEPDLSAADEAWDEALSWYDRILSEPGSEPWRAQALAGRVQVLVRADRLVGAVEDARRLLEQAPDSSHTPWAAVLIGDHYFGEALLAPAMEAYRVAVDGDDPVQACYARYKLAWCEYNLGDFELAVTTLTRMIELARSASPGPADTLLDEGLKDLVIMVEGLPLDRSLEVIDGACGPDSGECRARLLERLVRLLEEVGRVRDAEELRRREVRDP